MAPERPEDPGSWYPDHPQHDQLLRWRHYVQLPEFARMGRTAGLSDCQLCGKPAADH